jgi:hypothetical protein
MALTKGPKNRVCLAARGPHCGANPPAESVRARPFRSDGNGNDHAQDTDLDFVSERYVGLLAFGESAQNMVRAISCVFGTQSWRV